MKITGALKNKILYIGLASVVSIAGATTVALNRNINDTTVVYKTTEESSSYYENKTSPDIINSISDEISVSTTVTTEKVQTSTTTKAATVTTTTTSIVYEFPCDVNVIDKDGLMQIDGIGEVLAQRIIDYRNSIGIIYNMDLLENVNGIGYSTLSNLRNYLYVSDEDYRDMEETPNDENVNEEDENTDFTQMTMMTTTMQQMTTIETQMSQTQQVTPERKSVNVNRDDAQKIADNLLIDMELAESIVNVRNQITEYTNVLELLYADGMTEKLLLELKDYIEL